MVDRLLSHPETLPELRRGAGLNKADVGARLAERFGLAGRSASAKACYHEIETGQVAPRGYARTSGRPSRTSSVAPATSSGRRLGGVRAPGIHRAFVHSLRCSGGAIGLSTSETSSGHGPRVGPGPCSLLRRRMMPSGCRPAMRLLMMAHIEIHLTQHAVDRFQLRVRPGQRSGGRNSACSLGRHGQHRQGRPRVARVPPAPHGVRVPGGRAPWLSCSNRLAAIPKRSSRSPASPVVGSPTRPAHVGTRQAPRKTPAQAGRSSARIRSFPERARTRDPTDRLNARVGSVKRGAAIIRQYWRRVPGPLLGRVSQNRQSVESEKSCKSAPSAQRPSSRK